ncbi:hypothetical protein SAMN05660209_03730 [Geodermatophilus africanus]|uniref:Uncharacterized protein n=1 Tax=Geodermatophilus africanus TaxID=1137993 RepID=A0A1H3MQF1_9ACTN|nr:hypothetical protein [Geodermatophilus africanus]SDY78881.1 hypothetical protein SAMN05660209_03730 [Geodermatophilus africanus]
MTRRRPGAGSGHDDAARRHPQPRDIALELETPEQAADLEAQSEPEERPDGE